MSSSTTNVFLCLRWLCILVILCINSPTCHGVDRFCGKALGDALDLICVNGFRSKTKKSIEPMDYYADLETDNESTELDQIPYFSKISNNYLGNGRRRRHGVYDECCKKPCSLAELRTYCL